MKTIKITSALLFTIFAQINIFAHNVFVMSEETEIKLEKDHRKFNALSRQLTQLIAKIKANIQSNQEISRKLFPEIFSDKIIYLPFLSISSIKRIGNNYNMFRLLWFGCHRS